MVDGYDGSGKVDRNGSQANCHGLASQSVVGKLRTKMINSSSAASIVTTPMVIWGPIMLNLYLFQKTKFGGKGVGCVNAKEGGQVARPALLYSGPCRLWRERDLHDPVQMCCGTRHILSFRDGVCVAN
jgi:hypothetical protein